MSFRFQLLRPLRSGGYGDLYLAHRLDTGETVVVKYLRDHRSRHALRMFAREVRILGRNIPGIVGFLGCDLEANPPFYVMPYLQGGPVANWTARLSAAQLHFLALELAETLQRLHAAGIAHGDIKPENVLLTSDGHWRVADPLGNGWGCTVILSRNCGGTPGYWAPEVWAGAPISAAGDTYSYGATLYHVATGRQPRDGDRLDLAIARFAVPAQVRGVVSACCQPVPPERPSMSDVLRMLRGETLSQIRRNRAVALSTALGLGLLGAIALRR
jgi:serine/threonine protein kinase